MYADDTVLFLSSKDVNHIVGKINSDLVKVDDWLSTNKLSLNVSKSTFMLSGTSH